jgi:hypothetical protein
MTLNLVLFQRLSIQKRKSKYHVPASIPSRSGPLRLAVTLPSFLLDCHILLLTFLPSLFEFRLSLIRHGLHPDSSKVRVLTVSPQPIQARPLIPPANHLWNGLDGYTMCNKNVLLCFAFNTGFRSSTFVNQDKLLVVRIIYCKTVQRKVQMLKINPSIL